MLYRGMSFFYCKCVSHIAGVSYTPLVGEFHVSVEETFELAVCFL